MPDFENVILDNESLPIAYKHSYRENLKKNQINSFYIPETFRNVLGTGISLAVGKIYRIVAIGASIFEGPWGAKNLKSKNTDKLRELALHNQINDIQRESQRKSEEAQKKLEEERRRSAEYIEMERQKSLDQNKKVMETAQKMVEVERNKREEERLQKEQEIRLAEEEKRRIENQRRQLELEKQEMVDIIARKNKAYDMLQAQSAQELYELQRHIEEARRLKDKEDMINILNEDIDILIDITHKSLLDAIGLEKAFVRVFSKNISIICGGLADGGGRKKKAKWLNEYTKKVRPSEFIERDRKRERNQKIKDIVLAINKVMEMWKQNG